MLNNILVIIGFLFLLEGASYHSQPYYFDGELKPWNQEHNLAGIGFRKGRYSAEYIEYDNSMHRKTKMLKFSVLEGNFGINAFAVTGYNYKAGILPFYVVDIDNVELEVTFIPAMHGFGNTSIVTVMKRVVF